MNISVIALVYLLKDLMLSLLKKLVDYPVDIISAGYLLLCIGVLWLTTLVLLRKPPSLVRMGAILAITWILMSTLGYRILEPIRTPEAIMAKTGEAIWD